jgi:hypothetical protein
VSKRKPELEIAYLRAMHDWMNEEHRTRMLVMQQEASKFAEQVKKEDAARERYRKAQQAFINGPKG